MVLDDSHLKIVNKPSMEDPESSMTCTEIGMPTCDLPKDAKQPTVDMEQVCVCLPGAHSR